MKVGLYMLGHCVSLVSGSFNDSLVRGPVQVSFYDETLSV